MHLVVELFIFKKIMHVRFIISGIIPEGSIRGKYAVVITLIVTFNKYLSINHA
jgi:hypothetical protein